MIAIAVLSVAVLAACQGRVELTDGPVAIYSPSSEGTQDTSEATSRSGTIGVHNDCLVISRDTSESFVPLFPAQDVSWNEDAQELTYGGTVYGLGSEITVLIGADPEGHSVSTDCPAGRFGAVHPLP